MTNLLTNALRYGRDLPIELIVRKDVKYAFIEIIDQGIGIAKEGHTRIFERFERAISASEISALGYRRQILDMHHGSIRVESELDKSARLIVK